MMQMAYVLEWNLEFFFFFFFRSDENKQAGTACGKVWISMWAIMLHLKPDEANLHPLKRQPELNCAKSAVN